MYKQHVVIDFEMNPVQREYPAAKETLKCEIVEIGAVKLNEKYEVVEQFKCFIRPQFALQLASFIERLTGLHTKDIFQAASFEQAIQELSRWIGESKTRIYSWSNSDLLQLKRECTYKAVPFPTNMRRWLNFQAVFPRIVKDSSVHNQMGLKKAADLLGIEIDEKRTHDALYDAEVTANLVICVLTGEYISQLQIVHTVVWASKEFNHSTLGAKNQSVLEILLLQLKSEPQYAT